MAFAEDLSLFFDPAEFGTKAWLDGVEVIGIFSDAPGQTFEIMSSSEPQFLLPAASCGNAVPGSILRLATEVVGQPMQGGASAPVFVIGDTYRVRGLEPSGAGVTRLRLEVLV